MTLVSKWYFEVVKLSRTYFSEIGIALLSLSSQISATLVRVAAQLYRTQVLSSKYCETLIKAINIIHECVIISCQCS